MAKRILIISPGQFGTHNGIYQYCKLLSEDYLISYFGFNESRTNIYSDKIKFIHLESKKNSVYNKIFFLIKLRSYLKLNHHDFIMINYFLGCSFLNLFTREKLIVDIRSGYIYKNNFKRFCFNSLLLLEVSTFKNITVISKKLSKHLNLPKRVHHVPLGSPSFSNIEKKYESFKLLYVGTFHQRNLHQAIKGFSKFYLEYKDLIKMEMNLIGVGNYADIQLIKNTISELGVGHVVKYLGEIRYPELNKHFEYHNIGLSYIPLTQYFNFQPPTKTFEYLSSGMITIATSTVENISVINESNGILIRDNEDSLFEGLKFIYNNKNKYNSLNIQDNSRQYSWENIVFNNLLPYLNKLD